MPVKDGSLTAIKKEFIHRLSVTYSRCREFIVEVPHSDPEITTSIMTQQLISSYTPIRSTSAKFTA